MGVDRDWVKARLAGEVDRLRAETLRFALATVAATPGLLVVGALLLVAALWYADLPFIQRLGFRRSVVTGANLGLGFMLLAYFQRPKPKWLEGELDHKFEGLALAAFVGLLVDEVGTVLTS